MEENMRRAQLGIYSHHLKKGNYVPSIAPRTPPPNISLTCFAHLDPHSEEGFGEPRHVVL